MHFWAKLGDDLWWLRLPTALAVGVTAGLLADLGRRLGSRAAGIWAGRCVPAAAVHLLSRAERPALRLGGAGGGALSGRSTGRSAGPGGGRG